MIYNYNSDKLSAVTKDFFNVTGINICFLNNEFSALKASPCRHNDFCSTILKTKDGESLCRHSDTYILENCRKTKSVQIKKCHAGLVDVVVPVTYDDDILGYLILGQMKTCEDFESIKKHLKNCDEHLEELKKHYESLPLYDEERIRSVVTLASMLAEHIILTDALMPQFNQAMESALQYIDDHLTESISIDDLAKHSKLSPSSLYHYFQNYLGCTPKAYINKVRIKNAAILLKTTDLSIEVISQMSGFSTSSYFTKTFRLINGITPLKYRNNLKKGK